MPSSSPRPNRQERGNSLNRAIDLPVRDLLRVIGGRRAGGFPQCGRMQVTGQAVTEVAPDEPHQAAGVLESLTCELLDVVAVFVHQPPTRTCSSDFADLSHA